MFMLYQKIDNKSIFSIIQGINEIVEVTMKNQKLKSVAVGIISGLIVVNATTLVKNAKNPTYVRNETKCNPLENKVVAYYYDWQSYI